MSHQSVHLPMLTGARCADGQDPEQPPTPAAAHASRAPAEQGLRCACGHPRQAHEHYRKGKDCALCDCLRFHRRWFLGRRSR